MLGHTHILSDGVFTRDCAVSHLDSHPSSPTHLDSRTPLNHGHVGCVDRLVQQHEVTRCRMEVTVVGKTGDKRTNKRRSTQITVDVTKGDKAGQAEGTLESRKGLDGTSKYKWRQWRL